MSSFGPIGSFPIASFPGGGSGGTNISPGTGYANFYGETPIISGVVSPVYVGQVVRETMVQPQSQIAIYQIVRETMMNGLINNGDDTIISILW